MQFLRNSFKFTSRYSNLLLNQCCNHCQCFSRYLCSAASKKTSGQNYIVPVSCGCTTCSCEGLCHTSLMHTKILIRTLHVSGCGRRTKQHDDEPDFNIDFENELMWLKDSFTNASSQPSSHSSSTEVQKETLQKQWLLSSLPETKPLKSSMKHNYKNWSKHVIPPYRGNHIAKFKTGKSARPLTTDVTVELLACELRDLFGYDRAAAYKVASCVRKSYKGSYGVFYPALTDTDLAGARKIVEDAMATVRVYVAGGVTSDILYAVPMLVRVPAEDLPQKLELLQKAEFLPVGAPFLLLPLCGLQQLVDRCLLERRVLPQRADRLHFIADIFKIDVVTVACHVANTSFGRFFAQGLCSWACLADTINFYRIPTEAVQTHFRSIILIRSQLLLRFDALARMHNPPEVLAALAYENLGKTLVEDSLRKALAQNKALNPDKKMKFFSQGKIDKTRSSRGGPAHRIRDTLQADAPPVTSATSSPHHASSATPSPHHASSATPSPHHASSATLSSHHASSATPSPHHASPIDSSPHHATPTDSSPHHATPTDSSPHHASPVTPSPHHPSQEVVRPDGEAATATGQAEKETKAPAAKERRKRERKKKQRTKDIQQVFKKYIEDAGSSVGPQDGARLLERYTPPDMCLACSHEFKLHRSAEQRTEDTKEATAQSPSLP